MISLSANSTRTIWRKLSHSFEVLQELSKAMFGLLGKSNNMSHSKWRRSHRTHLYLPLGLWKIMWLSYGSRYRSLRIKFRIRREYLCPVRSEWDLHCGSPRGKWSWTLGPHSHWLVQSCDHKFSTRLWWNHKQWSKDDSSRRKYSGIHSVLLLCNNSDLHFSISLFSFSFATLLVNY